MAHSDVAGQTVWRVSPVSPGESDACRDVFASDMFHGMAMRCGDPYPFPSRDHYPTPGHGTPAPLELIRSSRVVPDVFMPVGQLVVSQVVAESLGAVSGVELREVGVAKLIDWEYDPQRDLVGFKRRTIDYGDVFELFPAVDAEIGRYFEIVCPTPDELAPACEPGDMKRVSLSEYFDPVGVCANMFREAPFVQDEAVLVRDDKFAVLDPHLDRGFFEVQSLEL